MVRTHHNSLRHFLEQNDMNKRKQKWVSKIQAYDCDIEYIKGKKTLWLMHFQGNRLRVHLWRSQEIGKPTSW